MCVTPSVQVWIFKTGVNVQAFFFSLEMLLRLSRRGGHVLCSCWRHKPGKEVNVKLFLGRTQSFMATKKRNKRRMK